MNNESPDIVYKVDYPYTLKNIPNIPEYLYIRGKIPRTQKYVCIVGSRSSSPYGEEALRYIISGLKNHSITIVSGLAIGIDTIAHKLAIENNLPTIAFPGSGLDESIIYPNEHLEISRDIVSHGGCLISPFKPDQQATRWTFPVRNRLMAAISNAIMIVEAKKHSGTLLTADYALEFGRDILAIPNNIFSPHAYGPNLLIKKGAYPITSSQDILDILNLSNLSGSNIIDSQIDISDSAKLDASIQNRDLSQLDKINQDIYRLIESGIRSKDALILETRLSPSQINVRLSQLEIDSYIRINDGEIFIRHA